MHLTTEVDGHVGVIWVSGDVDHLDAPTLSECAARMLDDGARSVVIDMAGVTFMNSSGINALIEARRQAELQFRTVTVRNPTSSVARILEITGLELLLDGRVSELDR